MKREFNDRLRGANRRDFVKGLLAASAAMGLGPTRALEMLDRLGGSALAADACVKASRSVNIIAGNGALSWFTLLWPVPSMIKNFKAGMAYDDPTRVSALSGLPEGRELYVRNLGVGQPALWDNFGANKRVSAILTGKNSGHEVAPNNLLNSNVLPDGVGGSVQVFAGSSAIQASLQPLVPVIGIKYQGKDMPYGPAPGAPPPATVPGAAEMIGLFSSAASRRMERLGTAKNQVLFETYYKAMLGLNRTADRATFQRAYTDSKVAVKLVGQNLGSALAVDQAKIDKWCGVAMGDDKLTPLAQALAITANAFKLGLVAEVNIPAFMDDPHTAFVNVASATKFADGLASVMQHFMDELALSTEVGCSKKLSDNVVITVSGDLPKDPYIAAGWPDATPGASNWIYVMSQGYIKPGWAGDVLPNQKILFDPRTGQMNPNGDEKSATNASMAAVLYAVSQGDERLVRNFFAGDYQGLVKQNIG